MHEWLDWLFRDRQTGRITVVQFPNIPLWVFLATVALRWIVPAETALRTAIEWIALVALAWWGLDELLRGVNPWRRLLGLAGLAFATTGSVSMLH